MTNTNYVVPSDPTSNWRHSGSGPGGVKWATGHVHAGNQASHGKWATGMNIWKSLNIATWNVRGLLETGKLAIVEKEISSHSIVGLAETHWKGSGHFISRNNNIIFYSGTENTSRNGVAIVISRTLENSITEYRAVSDRIILVRFNARPVNLNIVQVYFPTSEASDDEVDDCYSQLEQLLETLPNREITMLIGDYNAKIGREPGDEYLRKVIGKYGLGKRNARGERLLQFCTENNFFIANTGYEHHARRLYTWTSPGGLYKNQIDYILIKSRWRTSVKNTKTYPGKDCHSDHQFLAAELRIKLSRSQPAKTFRNLWGLKHNENFKTRAKAEISKLNSHTQLYNDSNSLWDKTKTVLMEVASETEATTKQKRKTWITEETWKKIESRKQLKTAGLHKEEDREQYNRLNQDIKRHCRNDKNKYLNDICAEIELHGHKNESKDLFNKVNQITRTFKSKSWAVRSDDGKLITDRAQARERWKNYCEKLMEDTGSAENHTQTMTHYEKEPPILKEEVTAAVSKLKNNKSPGEDGVVAEMLTALEDTGVELLHRICQMIWDTDTWPDDWTKSIYVPIHKKGPKDICDNYRTIALISHASKVMLNIISERIKPYLLPQLPPEQAGFVPGRGTREQILNIRQIIEKSREFNVPAYLCFIDYSKAFDCIRWQHLWNILTEMGTPHHLLSLIRHLYDNNTAYVRVEGELTSPFRVSKGVRQGCILSPLLFNIYGEWIMRKALDEWQGGITINGIKICNLRYADDTTLIAASEEELVNVIRRVEEISNEAGLQINKKKTKIMIIDRQNNNRSGVKRINNIETVDTFIYLGATISNKGGSSEEIKRRSAIAKESMTKLTKVWKNHHISLNTKTRLVRSLVFSIFLYGSECWTLKKADKQKIDAFEMFCWRRMLRVSWTEKRTNQSILHQLRIKKRLSIVVAEKIAKFFGHVVRRNGLERLTLEGTVPGKRSRGRSPTRYMDLITGLTGKNLTQTFKMAEDRQEWKAITENKT